MILQEIFVKTLLEVDEINGAECEKIADEFAIGFAEWLFDVSRIRTTKELLTIYKKEKQL